MSKVLVERDLLEEIVALHSKRGVVLTVHIEALAESLNQPAHDVASVPTFPCEFCGVFHSYSEVSEAGGYCPQCEADYDERKMFADLLERYTALAAAAAPQPVAQDGWIPVSEGLPESATDVLVYGINHGSRSYTVAGLFSGSWASQETEETTRFEPTHWTPLPSAPKGGE